MADKNKPGRVTTTFSLSDKGHGCLSKIAQHYGISKTAVLEMLIRAEARKIGLE